MIPTQPPGSTGLGSSCQAHQIHPILYARREACLRRGGRSLRWASEGVQSSGQMGECSCEQPGRQASFCTRPRRGMRSDTERIDHRGARAKPASIARTSRSTCAPTAARGVARRRARGHTWSLRTTVSRLRTTIGPATLRTDEHRVLVGGRCGCHPFLLSGAMQTRQPTSWRRWNKRFKLWTGPVLEEFQIEEWARAETARLSEIHAAGVDDYVEQLISAQRATDAIAAAEGQIGQPPYRDRSRGLLIRALALAGRQAEALRAFQTYRSLLVEEFGTEPSSEVVRTERRVATGWNGIGPEGELSCVDRGHGCTAAGQPGPPRSRSSGRSPSRKCFRTQLALVGESGSGASWWAVRLGWANDLARRVRQRCEVLAVATVLYGRCDETGVPLNRFERCWTRASNTPGRPPYRHVAHCGAS